MVKEETAPISEESISFLEEVKKGKPRKFAMICKGTAILSLVIYKKGAVEKRKKEAKEAGKGQFYFGSVDGKGIDIAFKLARADGFDSPPVKNTILKQFLGEQADFTCKPHFEIVEQPMLVLDDDDPLVIRLNGLQGRAGQACDAFPDRAAEINQLCLQAGQAIDQDNIQVAEARLAELETLLTSLAPGDGQPATAASPGAPPETPQVTNEAPAEPTTGSESNEPPPVADDSAAKLTEALKKLKPLMDKVVNSMPVQKGMLVQAFTAAAGCIKNKQFTEAQTAILELGKQIKSLLQAPTVQEGTADQTQQQEFDKRKSTLEKRMLEAQRLSPDKRAAIGNVWNYALEQAAAGNFANAKKAFDRLEQTVQAVLDSASSPGNTSTSNPPTPDAGTWEGLLKDVTPKLKRILSEKLGDFATIAALYKQAQAARSDDAAQALAVLQQCAALAEQALASSGGSSGTKGVSPTMAFRQARLTWAMAKDTVQQQLRQLKSAIMAAASGLDSGKLKELDAQTDRLYGILGDYAAQLQEQLDRNVEAQAADEQQASLQEAVDVLQRYSQFVNSDPLVASVDANPFGVSTAVKKTLSSNLDDLKQRFQAAQSVA